MLVLQKQNIKGFSLLELMVVLGIIAGISVASYPNFNSWRVDRELKHGLEKISTIVSPIISMLIVFFLYLSILFMLNKKDLSIKV